MLLSLECLLSAKWKIKEKKKLPPFNIHQSHNKYIVRDLFNVCSKQTTFKLQQTQLAVLCF